MAKEKTLEEMQRYIGTVIKDVTIIDVKHEANKNGVLVWKAVVKCNICGRERVSELSSILRGTCTSHLGCAHGNENRFDFLISKTIDDSVVLSIQQAPPDSNPNSSTLYWMATLKCNVCGRTKNVDVHSLLSNKHHPGSHRLCHKFMFDRYFSNVFHSVRSRCSSPNDPMYVNNGAKGIKCLWNDVDEFYNDMFEGYQKLVDAFGRDNITLTRYDFNKDYCKDNCYWTHKDTIYKSNDRYSNIFDERWNVKLEELRKTWVGQVRGDYVCIDVLKERNVNMDCYSPMLLIKCNVCGAERKIDMGSFMSYEGLHGTRCSGVKNYKEYEGQTFGDQKILEFFRSDSKSYYKTVCLKCGREQTIGCQKFFKRSLQTHEHLCVDPLGTARFRDVWHHLVYRCTNENDKEFKSYGGRGIKVIWNDFNEFYNDMWESYQKLSEQIGEKNVSIERINVDGNYCKENCKWIHLQDQCNNKCNTIYFKATSPGGFEYYGRNLNIFCKSYYLHHAHMQQVMDGKRNHHKGWTCKRITKEEYDEYCRTHTHCFNDCIWSCLNKIYEERIHDNKHVYPNGVSVWFREIEVNCHVCLWEELILNICSTKNPFDLDITFDPVKKCFLLKKASDFIEPELVG